MLTHPESHEAGRRLATTALRHEAAISLRDPSRAGLNGALTTQTQKGHA
jgi:hypothetical protein